MWRHRSQVFPKTVGNLGVLKGSMVQMTLCLRGHRKHESHTLPGGHSRDHGRWYLILVQDAQRLDRRSHSSTEASTGCPNGMRYKVLEARNNIGENKNWYEKNIYPLYSPCSSPFSLLRTPPTSLSKIDHA